MTCPFGGGFVVSGREVGEIGQVLCSLLAGGNESQLIF